MKCASDIAPNCPIPTADYPHVLLAHGEGLPMKTLWRGVQSMHRAAEVAQVQFVTEDTKVVDKGKEDGIFINRDLTRGGLATALVEIAEAAHLPISIDERKIPVHAVVRAALRFHPALSPLS